MLLLIAMPVAAHAQMLDVQPGARVRVVAPGMVAGRVEGTVISRMGDSVVLATAQMTQIRLALGSVTSLDLYRGRSKAAGARKGALWTGAITAPLLILGEIGDATLSDAEKVGFVAFGTGVWTGIGALIGMAVGAEDWSSYAFKPTVDVATKGQGLRIGGRVSF
jgi:hypothetical protein